MKMEVQFHENPQKSQIESLIPISSVISALDLAAQSTKNLTLTPSAISSLRSAHRLIGSFLAQFSPDNCGGGGGGGGDDDDEQMLDRNEEEQEEESKIMEEVEEGVRECVLQSKRRRKRLVSPSWVAGRDTADGGEELSSADLMGRRRSAIDLVFQFHA